MWQLNFPWYDPFFRALIIYLFVFLLVRLTGKKQLIRFTPIDAAILLITIELISKVVLVNNQNPLSSIITACVLGGINATVNELTYRFNWIEKIFLGRPEVVILNGKIHKRVLRKEKLTESELFEALREHEVMRSEDVKCAILETDGRISVIKYTS